MGMKRLLAVFLALLTLCSVLPPGLAAEGEGEAAAIPEGAEDAVAELSAGDWLTVPGIEGGQIQFDSSTGTITDCENTVTVANIPAEINGVAVTGIGEVSFQVCQNLTSVTIPDGVTSIGRDVFYWCENLTSVTIPSSVTALGTSIFLGCTSLTSVSVDEANPSYTVQNGVLFNKSMRELLWCPPTKEGVYAIPNSVTSIGRDAFCWCENLTSITIPDSVISIEDGAFGYCDGLTRLTIPNSVISIGKNSFEGCESLTNVTIPDSVTSIGFEAFKYCHGLTSVTLGKGVNNINGTAFTCCKALTRILVDEHNLHHTSQDGVLFSKSKTELVGYPFGRKGAYTILDSVTTIGTDAFIWCDGLTNVTIPDSVTTIGMDAFRGCKNLTDIVIPNSVTEIQGGAFMSCDSLTSIGIPASVTSMGWFAFGYCDSLTSVFISSGVSKIEHYNFINCPALTRIAIPVSVTSIEWIAFDGCPALTDVYYEGSETQWENIEIGSENDALLTATKHYFQGKSCWVDSVQTAGHTLTADICGEVSAMVYCAFYDADDRMLRVTSQTLTEELAKLSFSIPGGAVRGKILLLSPWQRPLCPAKEISTLTTEAAQTPDIKHG